MSRAEPLNARLSIWIVNPFDDIPGEGLPPLRYWSLARALAGRGHEVTWWTAGWSHRRKAPRQEPAGIRESEGFAVRLVDVRSYARNVSLARVGSHRDFGRAFERMAVEGVEAGTLRPPDILVASLPPLEGPEAACRLGKRFDAAVVCDLMDAWPETFARLLPGPAWLRLAIAPVAFAGMRARRDRLLAAADGISAASETYLDAVRSGRAAGGQPKAAAIHVCRLGAFVREFPGRVKPAGTESDTVEQNGPAAGPVRCAYAGSLEAGQDLDTLIRAARLLSKAGTAAEIHVAGTGSFAGKLRAAADSLEGPCRLVVHGLLPLNDYRRLLAEAEVGLVLVKPESFVAVPYKACDYAAAGLAIVNSLPGELMRLVNDHGAGVTYAAGDPASLAAAITALAADRPLLEACRAGGRRLAEEVFDREKTYPEFAEWIESIAATRRGGTRGGTRGG